MILDHEMWFGLYYFCADICELFIILTLLWERILVMLLDDNWGTKNICCHMFRPTFLGFYMIIYFSFI